MKAKQVYTFAFAFIAISAALVVILVLRSKSPSPEQAKSSDEKFQRLKRTTEEGAYAGGESASYYQAESTREMAERLRKMAEEANPETNIYENDKRVIYFKNMNRPSDLWSQLQIDAQLATELLYSGQSEEAVRQFSRILTILSENKYPQNLIATTKEFLALSYLRVGEQENCILHHAAESCLMPIQGSGIHTSRRGSKEAIKLYTGLLNENPNDLTSRWLLNIAYMTLGEYPDKVPRKWLIPPEIFRSDYDIKRFYDVAPQLGIDAIAHAGGSIMEDFNGDGYLDIMASSRGLLDQLRYFRNNADGSFTERTIEAGLKGVVGGINLCHADYNNDGFPDFYLGTGDPAFLSLMPNRMFRNAEGKYFQDVTTSGGFGLLQKGHGVAFGDIDNDGDQDIYAVIGGAYTGDVFKNMLFKNPGHGNHWITLKLEGVKSNRAAIGTRIKVEVNTENGVREIYNTVTTGGSFGASSLQQEIGLGQATSIQAIEITWPATGKIQVFKNVGMDQILKIREGDPVPIPVTLKRFDLSPDAMKAEHAGSSREHQH